MKHSLSPRVRFYVFYSRLHYISNFKSENQKYFMLCLILILFLESMLRCDILFNDRDRNVHRSFVASLNSVLLFGLPSKTLNSFSVNYYFYQFHFTTIIHSTNNDQLNFTNYYVLPFNQEKISK